MSKKADHDLYVSAEELLKILMQVKADSSTITRDFHDIGARCQWCQANLDTWLAIQCYKGLMELTKSLKAKGVID